VIVANSVCIQSRGKSIDAVLLAVCRQLKVEDGSVVLSLGGSIYTALKICTLQVLLRLVSQWESPSQVAWQ